jgi:NADP-dependent 3-hydroxy acid dehydrogenase YdfG/uncharacterized OB-fold protein
MSSKPPRDARDPLARRIERHVPPGLRSRALHAMSARAAWGRLVLQRCAQCRAITYPPRDICPHCWGELAWEAVPGAASVVAQTTIRATTDLYFRDHLPWRIGTVALDAGPVAIAHLHADLTVGDRADIRLMLDKGGNAALFAIPDDGGADMADLQWREFVVPVKERTILVTDGDNAVGKAVIAALLAAGARSIVAGTSTPARPIGSDVRSAQVHTIPLDMTDSISVSECFTGIAGPLDIVVNTARLVRTGGISRGSLVDQKRMLDVAVLGFLRLAQAAVPLLAGRPSAAFVDLLSIHALAGEADFASFSAVEAARHSLLQSFRHEMRGTGVRVISIFSGPTDDEDHQSVPMPKVAPARLARAVIEALEAGREQLCVGDVAIDAMDRWLADPTLYAREKNL